MAGDRGTRGDVTAIEQKITGPIITEMGNRATATAFVGALRSGQAPFGYGG